MTREGDRRPQRLTIYHSQLEDGTGGFYVHRSSSSSSQGNGNGRYVKQSIHELINQDESRSDHHWADDLEESVPVYKNAVWLSSGR